MLLAVALAALTTALLRAFGYENWEEVGLSLGTLQGPEGIVLAADSQLSLRPSPDSNLLVQAHYDNATKLLKVKDHGQRWGGYLRLGGTRRQTTSNGP